MTINRYGITIDTDEQGVATLWLDRADKCNAFNDLMIQSLHDGLADIANNSEVKILVIRARGEYFCAGADLDWMSSMLESSEHDNYQDALSLANVFRLVDSFPCPVVGLVEGNAFGGGCGLLCCCDMVMAKSGCQFAFSEVALGLVPATISPYVISSIGQRHARHYCVSGEHFDASRAYDMGLVSHLVNDDELTSAFLQLKKRLLNNGAIAMKKTKALIANLADIRDGSVVEETSWIIARVRIGDEAQEGCRAFIEKRRPDWIDE